MLPTPATVNLALTPIFLNGPDPRVSMPTTSPTWYPLPPPLPAVMVAPEATITPLPIVISAVAPDPLPVIVTRFTPLYVNCPLDGV